jgi:hypothetical protein
VKRLDSQPRAEDRTDFVDVDDDRVNACSIPNMHRRPS